MNKSLEDFKDDYAKENDYDDFYDLLSQSTRGEADQHFSNVAFRYAGSVAEQALKDAADKHRDTHKTLSDWENAVEEIRETPIVTL